jgi:hypothetical protein
VDSGFNQNKSVFGVFVLSVLFQVLSNRDSLFNQVVKILGDLRSTSLDKFLVTVFLEDSQDFFTSDKSDLGDTVLISKEDSDLTGAETLFGQFHNNITDCAR